MTHSTTLQALPTSKHPVECEDDRRTAVSLPTPSLEDRHLAVRVEHALRARGYSELRAIEVFVDTRIVCLVGRVPSYYLKQLAQETARAVPGAHQIHNVLEVIEPSRPQPEL